MHRRAPRLPLFLALAACGDATGQLTTDSAGTGPQTDTTAPSSSGEPGETTGDPTTGPSPTATSTPEGTTAGATTEATTADTAGTTTDTGETDTGTDTGEPDPYLEADPLFAFAEIAEIDITLSPAALLALEMEPKEYTQGDVTATIAGEVHELVDVGIRLKGNYGSFRTLEQKAAFLLNFDRYVDDQRLLGLEKLAVNNMVQDCSAQREVLGYALFRDAGVPSPRAGHAVVRVNGEPYGLYTTVEAVDNEVFLDHWFGDDQGNLYEGAYGSDITVDLAPSFDLDNGDDVAFADLIAWALALDDIQDPETFPDVVAGLLDLDRYLAFAATEVYLGHWDGYAWTRNNFFVYNQPGDQRWVFMPWGIDQTLRDHLDPFGGGGRLEQMCAASIPCRQLLAAQFEAVVARVDALGLPAAAQELADAIYEAVDADPRKECGTDSHLNSVAENIAFYGERPQSIADGLLCTVPSDIDVDQDGFSGCSDDCDDDDDQIYPGSPEVCDLDDDNCNGVWDDDPQCPQCVTKDIPGPGQARFCFGARPYADADADCKAQGGNLLSIHSQAGQDWATAEAFAIHETDWWIGLNDLKTEGTFVWSDGTPLDYENWNEGEPNNAGGEDCANLPVWAGGLWNDLPCGQSLPYICRVP